MGDDGSLKVKDRANFFQTSENQDLPLSPDYENLNSGYQRAYFYEEEGRVFLGGTIHRKTGVVGSGETLATLPIGYRPILRIISRGQQYGGSPRVDITSNGSIVVFSGLDSSDYISLEGISFKLGN